jgi:hypothetical protein
MSVRKTFTLTTRVRSAPASARMALMPSQQAAVCVAMLPVMRVPVESAGMQPEM